MPKISFFLRSNNDNLKSYVLYCRVSINSKAAEFSLGEKLEQKEWIQESQKVRSKNKERERFVNTLINSVEYKLKQIACLHSVHDPKKLIAMLKGKGESIEPPIPLTQVLNDFIRSEAKTKTPTTIRNHYIKLKNLEQFQKNVGIVYMINPSCDRTAFDLPTAEKFKDWFMFTKKTRNITTASRCVELYKNAMHHAVKKGMIKTFDLSLYKTERDPGKNPVFLTSDEVLKIIQAKFQSPFLERVRDLYLFQIGTGLSFSDIWGDWKIKNVDAGLVLTGTRTKTKQAYFVPVNSAALAVLEKYDYELPKYENQVYNRILKEIAASLGINKRLTTHSGRKTFATLMDQDGWSMESISRMLGHTSVRTTETYYIGRTFTRVENEMKRRSGSDPG